jgi:hypothetical protein
MGNCKNCRLWNPQNCKINTNDYLVMLDLEDRKVGSCKYLTDNCIESVGNKTTSEAGVRTIKVATKVIQAVIYTHEDFGCVKHDPIRRRMRK